MMRMLIRTAATWLARYRCVARRYVPWGDIGWHKELRTGQHRLDESNLRHTTTGRFDRRNRSCARGERVARRRSGSEIGSDRETDLDHGALEREAPGPREKRAAGRAAATHALVAVAGERVRAFTEQAQVAAFVKDRKGRYVYTNPDMFELFGIQPRSDWRGKTDADIWPPDLAAVLGADDQAVVEQGAFRAFRQAIPLSDGLHTFLVMKFPLPSERGQIDVAGVGVDITEQAQTEAERDRLAAAIEQVAESVIVTDRDGSITYVNPAFERVTGYRRNEV